MGIGVKRVDQIVKWFSTLLPINEEELGRWLQTEYQEVGSKTFLLPKHSSGCCYLSTTLKYSLW